MRRSTSAAATPPSSPAPTAPKPGATKRQRKSVPLGDVTNLPLHPETPTPIKPRRTGRRPLPASSTCSSSASVTPALNPSSSASTTPAPEPPSSSSAPVTPAPQPSSSATVTATPRPPSTASATPAPESSTAATATPALEPSFAATVTPAPKPSFAAVLDEEGSVFESPTICTVYARRRTTEVEAEVRRNPTITNKGKEPVSAAASCPPLGKSTRNISVLALFFAASLVSAQLTANFYDKSCPNALYTIQTAVRSAVARENRMGASLLRLHFHDCFVNGCDGSVLLDDTPTFTGEKTAVPNNNSLRGFDVIDSIKAQLERICPQVVSCADIVAVAARDSVVALGGPTWAVNLGRRDSLTASLDAANNDIPAPTLDLTDLTKSFSNKKLSATDMIALSGGDTIGQARCVNFRNRIYSETNIDTSLATSLQTNCPNKTGDNNISPLDAPYVFDNFYYKNLLNKKGVLHSDQQLFNGGSADSQTMTYSSNMAKFFTDCSAAMVKMSNISPLTGSSGQIRKNCRRVN